MKKVAIVTGCTGQVGSLMCRKLLREKCFVIGLKRRTSLLSTDRIDDIFDHPNFILRYCNLFDSTSIYRLIGEYRPDYLFSFAAQSHVKVSFEVPEETVKNITLGTLRILEAIKTLQINCRFYHSASSEMYGSNNEVPLNENSKMLPVSPYAAAKLAAYNLVKIYRNSYNMFASNGIMFNTETPGLRGETFVTRKISMAAAKIKLGLQKFIELGNIKAYRDWQHGSDAIDAIWKIMNYDKSDDFCICSGETHSVEEYLDLTFKYANLGNYKDYLKINAKYNRPLEIPILLGDSSKLQEKTGWNPKIKFDKLVKLMYDKDLELLKEKINGKT